MAGIRFESVASTGAIHNPLNGFSLEQQHVEVRRDPLLSETAYRNDDYFLQKLLQADVVVTPPEELARELRACF